MHNRVRSRLIQRRNSVLSTAVRPVSIIDLGLYRTTTKTGNYSSKRKWVAFLDSGYDSILPQSLHVIQSLRVWCSLQTKYGSVHGSYFGYIGNKGYDETITLTSDEFVREIKVGYAQMRYEFSFETRLGLCYLQFTSNLRSFGPYSGKCAETEISTHSLASGLAYFSGHGDWCIEGLTMNYFRWLVHSKNVCRWLVH